MDIWQSFGTKKPHNHKTISKKTTTKNEKPISQDIFYFQVRESIAPLNIPTPTPAPDRAGPGACLGGPVAYSQSSKHNSPTVKQQAQQCNSANNSRAVLQPNSKHNSENYTRPKPLVPRPLVSRGGLVQGWEPEY